MGHLHGVDGSPSWKLKLRALRIAILLSLLFLVLYGTTNWWTAQRPTNRVLSWYFSWELTTIPYMPWTIVPYMSIDVLFFFAPFLCRTEQEQNVFAKRMVFAYLAATALFLLVPLKLAWPMRPSVEGWFGLFVEQSVTVPFLMEYPHNLFPAMHITHAVLLADIYGRHTRGLLRIGLYVWFVLIGLSTVLAWQHHVIDIVGGLVLAGFACYFFREVRVRSPVVRNFRIGAYYALGVVAVLACAPAIWPWGVFLFWPATALGAVACGYFGSGPSIYRKEGGRLPLSAKFVLLPILVGQYLSLIYYRRQCRPWDEVAPGLLIGRTLAQAESVVAIEQGVTAVLDLTAEFSETEAFRAVSYRNLPILDLTAPSQEQLREAVAFIVAESTRGTVYVHCKIGYSRSGAVVAAYLLASKAVACVEESVTRLREVRPAIVLRSEVLEALHTFADNEAN